MSLSHGMRIIVCLFLATLQGDVVHGETTGGPNAVALINGQTMLDCIISYLAASSWTRTRDGASYPITIATGCNVTGNNSAYYRTEQHGSNVCRLIIANVTMEQAGVYECYDGFKGIYLSLVTVIDPVASIVVYNQSEVVADDQLNISCSINYNGPIAPAPSLRPSPSWTTSPGQIYYSATYHPSTNVATRKATVTVQKPTVPIFQCNTVFEIIGNSSSYNPTPPPDSFTVGSTSVLDVQYVPDITNVTSSVSITDNCVYKQENLTCTADANPPAQYEWISLDHENDTTSSGAVRSITSGGRYQCTAYNHIRNNTYDDRQIVTETDCYPVTSNNMTISGPSCSDGTCNCFGSPTVTLTCVVHSFPEPTYAWLFGNYYLGSNQTIEAMFDGTYSCTAYNIYGGIRNNATISVVVSNCKDPCSFSTGLTTASAVGSTTDDPCTTISTRAETTAADTSTEEQASATTIRPSSATPSVSTLSTLGTTTSRAETTTTPPHNPCYPNPCRNGATCVDHGTTYSCICVPGFNGQNCSVEINECESSPCYPFGKCTDLISDYNCSCNPGYEPLPNNTKTCNETDFCAKETETQPCFNGGTCVNQNALSRYYCLCPVLDGKQYVGLHCETELITKPTVNGGISPTSGIIAGGANVTIRGQGMNVFEPLGAYLIDTTSSPMHSLYAYAIPNLTLSASITVRVPPAEHAYVDRNLLMIVEYTGPINVTSEAENLRFKYTGNPVIETIEPKEILVLGGVHLTVSGSNMDTVQNPMMDITTFVVNKTGNYSVTNYSRESCSLSSASAITCLVPHGIVPSSFFNNTTPVGKSRLGVVHLESSFRHKTGSRRRKRAPVANLTDEAGSTFEMYLGFIFDEFPTYNNISKSLPHVTLTLVSPRVNFTPGSSVDFVSNKMDTISLYGSGFTFGCSMGDYQVLVSNAPCNVTSLTDNELQCRPPKEEPPINDSSSFCVSATDPHPVKVFIGGETHLGCCLSYTTDYTDIIIAVTVSCVVVVAIIILVAVLVYKRHRKNKAADQVGRNAKHSSTDLHPPKEETVNGPANDYDYMVPYGDGVASTFVGMNPGKQKTTVVEMPLRSYPTSTRPAALAGDDYLKPRDSKVVLNDYGGIGDIRGDSSARARDKYADVDDIGEISFKKHGTRPISDPEIDYLFNDNGEIDDIRGDSSGRTYDNYGHVDDVGHELSIKKHGTRPLSEPEIDY